MLRLNWSGIRALGACALLSTLGLSSACGDDLQEAVEESGTGEGTETGDSEGGSSSESASSEATSGDGDGDGSTGDGDGDGDGSTGDGDGDGDGSTGDGDGDGDGSTGDGDGDGTTGDGDGDGTTGDGDGDGDGTTGDGDGDGDGDGTTGDGDGDGDGSSDLCTQFESFYVDADQATLSGNWGLAQSSVSPQEGVVIFPQGPDGAALFSVEVPCEDNWYIWVRGLDDAGDDSFFLTVDGSPTPPATFDIDCSQQNQGLNYLWAPLNQRGNTGCGLDDPWVLSGGPTTFDLEFTERENGAISELFVTNNPGQTP